MKANIFVSGPHNHYCTPIQDTRVIFDHFHANIRPATMTSDAITLDSMKYWYAAPLEIVRAVFFIVAIVAYVYTITLLWRKEVYNGNLRLLLTVFPLSPTITLFANFAQHIMYLRVPGWYSQGAFSIIAEITNTGVISRVLNCMLLIIDRLIALYCTNTYENSAPYLAVAVVSMQFLGAVLLALPCTYGLVDDATQAYILCSATFVFDVVFALLFIAAKKLHALHRNLRLSVQHRFLSVENLRAGRLLTYLMVAFTIFNSAETLFFTVIYNSQDDKPLSVLLTLAELFLCLEVCK
ncbi:hypothetical protein Y032_0219g2486 [Ancylostoma ceylanicum]|uniref:Uncharacterized protein n=2 Tax=Ancylostoma ceylanicum TaxID=53326 RepID=A0A016SJT5_9BILA|nr:hypothetical protein Y032_0219g2486 [Ancylostoma ceylanicum]